MIFFRPIQDKNTASSRLRVWNIQPFIPNSKIAIANKYTKDDTVVIQKIPDIELLRTAKSQGARVIYDIDDYYWSDVKYHEMLDECDHITVDTEVKKEIIEKFHNLKGKVTVIPDSLDWDGTIKEKTGSGVIGWTGYGNNSQYLNPILKNLPFPIRLITTADWTNYIHKDNVVNVQSRPWSLAMADKYLAECDLGLYYLPDGEFEQCKGMHKLLKNWAIGIPTYTSPMPDYVKAMKEAGVGEKYLVKSIEDWKNIKFVKFDEKLRDYAMKFKPEEIAKQWIKLIN
jgi:hypothetical protein